MRLLLFLCLIMGLQGALYAQNAIRINEVCTINPGTITDEDGDESDWIELYNSSDTPQNLKNYKVASKRDSSAAWVLPDTVLGSGKYMLLWMSGKDRRSSGYYTIEAAGLGANPWNIWDSYHFQYLAIKGDFDISMHVHSLQNTATYAKSGLVLLDTIDRMSRYVGMFSTTRRVFSFQSRSVAGEPPSFYMESSHIIRYPDSWVRLRRIGDSVYAYASLLGDYWDSVGVCAFVPSHPIAYVGIAVTSQSDDTLTRTTLSNILLNGGPLPIDSLKKIDLYKTLPSSSYFSKECHTNFELKNTGGVLYLWDDKDVLVDSLAFRNMRSEITAGHSGSSFSDAHYYSVPTPGDSNATRYSEIVSDPVFSLPGGIYKGSLQIGLTAEDPEADIRYTLNGAVPDSSSSRYQGTPLILTTTTVLRARAFKPNTIPGRILTETYVLNEPIHLPVFSIVTDSLNLWDEQDGIFSNIFLEMEKPVHLEFWEKDGTPGFALDAGVKLQGRATRSLPQRSMRFYARSKYETKEIKYQIFSSKNISTFKTLVSKNAGQDFYLSYLRNVLLSSLSSGLDIDIQAYRPCMVFLNGQYYGIQNMQERVDENYIVGNHSGNPDSIDLIEDNYIPNQGSARLYHEMVDSLTHLHLKDPSAFDYAASQMEVGNYLDYYITEIYGGVGDFPLYNVKFWRNRESKSRWRWILYDADEAFYLYDGNPPSRNNLAEFLSPEETTGLNVPQATFLIRKLLENQQFTYDFINRFADLLNTTFLPDNVRSLTDSLAGLIALEVPRHHALYDTSLANWQEELERIHSFTEERPAYIRQYIVEQFKLPGQVPLTLDVSDPHAGYIHLSTLTLTSFPWYGIYFKDVPVRVTAIPHAGYRFVRWSDPHLPDSASVLLALSDTSHLIAIFKDTLMGSLAPVISEIMYKAPSDADCGDWVELYNPDTQALDLSGWVLKDDKDSHVFLFPSGATIPANGFIVASGDMAAFTSVYPSVKNYVGQFDFGLGSDSDQVRLYDRDGVLQDSVAYRGALPWPPEANNGGATLELISPFLDNTQPKNWRASHSLQGTPGMPSDQSLVVSEDTPVHVYCAPNPSSGYTRLSYTLPVSSYVRILLTDVLGQTISTLRDNVREEAGEYMVPLQTTLTTGSYFCVLEVGTSAGRKRIVVPIIVVR